MSQHDFNIANQLFPATRADLNNSLVALASNSSGDAEPSTTYANQWWYETDSNTLKLRNEANTAWVPICILDQGNNNVLSITTQGLTLGATTITASGTEINQLDAITRGSLIYGNASGVTSRLAKGGAATVLTSDGTDIAWAAAAGGGATGFIASSGAISNAASVSFTGFDASSFDHYIFYMQYVKPATDAQELFAYASVNGGTSYDTTNGNYHQPNTTDRTSFSVNASNTAGNDTNEYGISGRLFIYSPAFAAYTYAETSGVLMRSDGSVIGLGPYNANRSVYLSTTAVNAIQFKFGSGNIASGEITMIGIKNA